MIASALVPVLAVASPVQGSISARMVGDSCHQSIINTSRESPSDIRNS